MNMWNSNTDELIELTIDFLPEPWKTMCENQEIFTDSVPDDVLFKAMEKAEQGFFSSAIDAAEY